MSSLEMNKIAAAVLTAGVVAMSSGFIANLLTHPPELEENVYVVATAEDDGAGAEVAADSGPESILPLLAAADLAAGEKVARKCTACHTFEQGGKNKIGPNLWNTLGRAAGGAEGFAYSSAFQDLGGQAWDYEGLSAFLENPKAYAPGTKMSFAGLRKAEDRAALVAYMRTLSDSPLPMPSPEEVSAAEGESPVAALAEAAGTAAEAAESAAETVAETVTEAVEQVAEAADGALATLLAAADSEAGAKVARKCKACHTFEQGGKNKLGPNLYGIIGQPIAANPDYKYSQALQEKSGETWSYQNLAAYLESPKTWAPGNKMTFAGLKKPKDQAALIAFLRSNHDDPPPLPE